SSACSAVRVCRSVRTPNTISEAIENNSRPPAMRKAGSEMPRVVSSQCPTRAAPTRMPAAMAEARSATLRWATEGRPWVTARKVGARPIGSTTTNKVTSGDNTESGGIGTGRPRAQRRDGHFLEHDHEKWTAVFGKACPRARPEGSCANNQPRRDDDAKKTSSHFEVTDLTQTVPLWRVSVSGRQLCATPCEW